MLYQPAGLGVCGEKEQLCLEAGQHGLRRFELFFQHRNILCGADQADTGRPAKAQRLCERCLNTGPEVGELVQHKVKLPAFAIGEPFVYKKLNEQSGVGLCHAALGPAVLPDRCGPR